MATDNTTTIILQPGTPLFVKAADAVKLFGVGRTTLYKLRRDHKDFDECTIKCGHSVLYDVRLIYAWLQSHRDELS